MSRETETETVTVNDENNLEAARPEVYKRPIENPPDGVLADPRANDPNQTPESKEDAASFPAEHEARLAEEIGAHGEAEQSRLEAEHARAFQRDQQRAVDAQTDAAVTPAPPQQPVPTTAPARPTDPKSVK